MKIFFTLSICLFVVCPARTQSIVTLHIDPDNAFGAQVSDLFDSVNYIPLETKSESVFGRIDKLMITKEYFIILDHSKDAIFLFKKDGQFHSKISPKKLVDNTYSADMGIHDFTVNEAAGSVIISDWQNQFALYSYDFQGNLQEVIEDKLWKSFACIDDTHYLMESYGDVEDKDGRAGNCIIADKNIKVFEKFLLNRIPSNFQMSAANNITTSYNNGYIFYTRSYDYKAYQINNLGVSSIYRFVLPLKYTLSPQFLDSSFIGKQKDYLSHQNPVYSLSDVYKINNMLSFSIDRLEDPIKTPFMYDLRSGTLYSPIRITPDSVTNFLPIFGGGQYNILGADDRSIYTSLAAYSLENAYDQNKDKYPVQDPALKNFLKNRDRKSNPVIVRLNFKKEI